MFKRAVDSLDGFSLNFALMGNVDMARTLYLEAQTIRMRMQTYEPGLFPITLQQEVAISSLKRADFKSFLQHLRGYLHGGDVPVYRYFTPAEAELQIQYMTSHAREYLYALEKIVLGEMEYLRGSVQNKKIAGIQKLFGMLMKRARENPNGYPQRFPVPEDKKKWSTPFPGYAPRYWVNPKVLENDYQQKPGGWADSENKRSDTKRRRNPRGRTGLTGRASLGHWEENPAVDLIVTRMNPKTKIWEVLRVQRTLRTPVNGRCRAAFLT